MAFESVPHFEIRTVDIYKGARKLVTVPLASLEVAPRVIPQAPMLEMIVREASRLDWLHAGTRRDRARSHP